ncbi:hypothetical protein K458DRAFT_390199 [Lentithecium fluviatile CBS 122367]|uniref:Uncharacterized protein n=1 Tax=Lentithecium fluviatile CBS 122367 TaxID=1168545 RepID=A0A6G1IXE1_9PLEO|nr:hypothetical protein K458DRAFT_390199 [Lentithecium fluviatile CBS 122367]
MSTTPPQPLSPETKSQTLSAGSVAGSNSDQVSALVDEAPKVNGIPDSQLAEVESMSAPAADADIETLSVYTPKTEAVALNVGCRPHVHASPKLVAPKSAKKVIPLATKKRKPQAPTQSQTPKKTKASAKQKPATPIATPQRPLLPALAPAVVTPFGPATPTPIQALAGQKINLAQSYPQQPSFLGNVGSGVMDGGVLEEKRAGGAQNGYGRMGSLPQLGTPASDNSRPGNGPLTGISATNMQAPGGQSFNAVMGGFHLAMQVGVVQLTSQQHQAMIQMQKLQMARQQHIQLLDRTGILSAAGGQKPNGFSPATLGYATPVQERAQPLGQAGSMSAGGIL